MRALVLCLVLALAACGSRLPARLAAPLPYAPRPVPPDPSASGITYPNFGDTKPVEWGGRPPTTYPVHGIDISRWQGQVDWATARANGVNFAFLKATEGGDVADPLYETNARAARAAGVPVGAYHFWYHCRPAREQARWFFEHVPRVSGALPPVLDMEWTTHSRTCRIRPPAADVRAEAKIFLDLLERHYGQRPIIYVTPDFFADTELWRVGDYDFWLRSVAGHPQDVYAGRHWTFWQYSGTGVVPGVSGKTDVNVFAGNSTSWAAWLAQRSRP